MKKSSKFQVKRPASGDLSLNITAMADIFTVILVFLLKGFTTSAMAINPTAGTELPNALADALSADALKVEITRDTVLVESKPAAILENFRLPAKDLRTDGASTALAEVFDLQRKRQALISKSNSDVKADARIILISDRRVPYSTLKAVMASAAGHGYTDFKLAVVTEGN